MLKIAIFWVVVCKRVFWRLFILCARANFPVLSVRRGLPLWFTFLGAVSYQIMQGRQFFFKRLFTHITTPIHYLTHRQDPLPALPFSRCQPIEGVIVTKHLMVIKQLMVTKHCNIEPLSHLLASPSLTRRLCYHHPPSQTALTWRAVGLHGSEAAARPRCDYVCIYIYRFCTRTYICMPMDYTMCIRAHIWIYMFMESCSKA